MKVVENRETKQKRIEQNQKSLTFGLLGLEHIILTAGAAHHVEKGGLAAGLIPQSEAGDQGNALVKQKRLDLSLVVIVPPFQFDAGQGQRVDYQRLAFILLRVDKDQGHRHGQLAQPLIDLPLQLELRLVDDHQQDIVRVVAAVLADGPCLFGGELQVLQIATELLLGDGGGAPLGGPDAPFAAGFLHVNDRREGIPSLFKTLQNVAHQRLFG